VVQTQEIPNKLCFFHHNYEHDTKKCHALIKKIEKLISIGYLQEFILDEIQYDQTRILHDTLPQIK
jgi:hypothetical protein